MDDDKAPVKAKGFVGDGSKRGRPKQRWKEAIEKDILARGFKNVMLKTALYGR